MITIEVRFMPSQAAGKTGSIHFLLTSRQQTVRLATPYRVLARQWDGTACRILSGKDASLDSIQRSLDDDLARLRTLVGQFGPTGGSIGEIAARFCKSYKKKRHSLFELIRNEIAVQEQLGHLGTARNYRRTLASFAAFREGRDLTCRELSEKEIGAYEQWLRQKRVTRNSSSFYMRNLRALYNRTVGTGTAGAGLFRQVYTGVDTTRKRAVTEATIRRLRQADLADDPQLSYARDLFLFSFYCRGMAFVDIAYLTHGDLCAGFIRYARRKTGKTLTVKVEPCIQAIINRYRSPSPYVFPILTPADERTMYRRYQGALCRYNQALTKLSGRLGILPQLSSYVSRHSWATIARNKQIPVSIISEGMGHATEQITRIYLASLDQSVIDNANSLVISL